MRILVLTPSFKKKLSRFLSFHPEFENKIQRTLALLMKDVFNPRLKTHKLSGKMKSFYSSSIDYQHRVIFVFDSKNVFLLNLGTHKEVY